MAGLTDEQRKFLIETELAVQESKYHYNRGRNDAIEEFIEKLTKHEQENWIDHQEYGITWSDIEKIAKEMKGSEENG